MKHESISAVEAIKRFISDDGRFDEKYVLAILGRIFGESEVKESIEYLIKTNILNRELYKYDDDGIQQFAIYSSTLKSTNQTTNEIYHDSNLDE